MNCSYFNTKNRLCSSRFKGYVQYRYAYCRGNDYFMVMRYYSEGDLQKVFKNTLLMSNKLVLLYHAGVSLSEMHQKKIMHCDIKPQNMLSDDKKAVAIADLMTVTRLNRSYIPLQGTRDFWSNEFSKLEDERKAQQYLALQKDVQNKYVIGNELYAFAKSVEYLLGSTLSEKRFTELKHVVTRAMQETNDIAAKAIESGLPYNILDAIIDCIACELDNCEPTPIQLANHPWNLNVASSPKLFNCAIKYLCNQSVLRIVDRKLTIDGVKNLHTYWSNNAMIQVMDLSKNRIDDATFLELINCLQSCTSLKTLVLCRNNIGITGTNAAIQLIRKVKSFKVINMSFNAHISGKNIKQLCSLAFSRVTSRLFLFQQWIPSKSSEASLSPTYASVVAHPSCPLVFLTTFLVF